jgi:hypothetical protein
MPKGMGYGHAYSGYADKRTDAETKKMAHDSAASWGSNANVKTSRLPNDGAQRKGRKASSRMRKGRKGGY